jgi:hypothetical protein
MRNTCQVNNRALFDEVPERSVERAVERPPALLPTDLCARCQFPRSDRSCFQRRAASPTVTSFSTVAWALSKAERFR